MGNLSNPVSATSLAGMQATSEKGQNSGYLGIGSSGEVAAPGKVGFNGATPVGKAADMGTASTTVSISLVEALSINTPLNNLGKQMNEVRKCLRECGLMT